MSFKGEGLVLTDQSQLRANRKVVKIEVLKDSNLVRGCIVAEERGNDLSNKIKALFRMTEKEDFLKGKSFKPAKEGFKYIPCPQYIVDRGSRQDIRVKPDRTYEKKLTRHEETVIHEYINELKFIKDEVLS